MAVRVILCTNRRMGTAPSCGARGSREVIAALKAMGVEAEAGPCLGLCARGPNAKILPGGTVLHEATAASVAAHLDGSKATD